MKRKRARVIIGLSAASLLLSLAAALVCAACSHLADDCYNTAAARALSFID